MRFDRQRVTTAADCEAYQGRCRVRRGKDGREFDVCSACVVRAEREYLVIQAMRALASETDRNETRARPVLRVAA